MYDDGKDAIIDEVTITRKNKGTWKVPLNEDSVINKYQKKFDKYLQLFKNKSK